MEAPPAGPPLPQEKLTSSIPISPTLIPRHASMPFFSGENYSIQESLENQHDHQIAFPPPLTAQLQTGLVYQEHLNLEPEEKCHPVQETDPAPQVEDIEQLGTDGTEMA